MMATDDGLILTGAFADVDGVADAGAAYLINPVTGATVFTMPHPEAADGGELRYGQFAWAGDTRIVVTDFFKKDGEAVHAGRAYVFNRSNGQFIQTIRNPTPETEDQFGYGLGMLGDIAIITARADNAAGPGTGTVYLFNTLNGSLIRTIINPDPTVQDNFGYSVAAIGDDKILVGAPGNDTGETDSGAAFLINANTGQVIHKILNPDPSNAAYFGFQVRAHGEDLLIGAPGNNKAYLYDGETGALIHRFENPNRLPGAAFGAAVASAGRYILIGNAFEPFGSQLNVGKAYLYNADTGLLTRTITNPTPEANDRFGVSVVGSNGNLVISADLNTVGAVPMAGSFYVFKGILSAACGDWNLYQ